LLNLGTYNIASHSGGGTAMEDTKKMVKDKILKENMRDNP
jgi:hypothetical protein